MKLAAFLFSIAFFTQTQFAQKDLTISQIQGDTNTSVYAKEKIRTTGIVTARTKSGFFIQMPVDPAARKPNTSEAVFVFTKEMPPTEAAVGNLVSITGEVVEFRRNTEPHSLTLTEISFFLSRDEIKVISNNNSLPQPVAITASDFMTNTLDSLEKYEGMRVAVDELKVVGPTDGRFNLKSGTSVSNGVFYGVVKNVPRPFREPGFDVAEMDSEKRSALLKSVPKAAFFDSNPEMLRIDSDEQITGDGKTKIPALEVASTMTIQNLVGVLHYGEGRYTIFPDPNSKQTWSAFPKPTLLNKPTEKQITVAAMNLENLFDDVDDPGIREDVVTTEGLERRFYKISATVLEVMRTPDIIGVVEAENLAVLKRLAARINADALKSGLTDPKYEAILIDGNDSRGIDTGFLVKSSRLKLVETLQIGKDEKYKNPDTNNDDNLHDRTPLLITAALSDVNNKSLFEVTVIVSHMKSYLGYNDPKQMANVRLKKRLQSESLAKFVQDRQSKKPDAKLVLVGDFNAFQFNDGVLDVIGTIKGTPAGKDSVLHPSDDFVNPNLLSLVDAVDRSQRYSYIFDGTAQTLDHMLISQSLRSHIVGFGFARVNADYPESARNDSSVMYRFSDHDPAIAVFSIEDSRKKNTPK